MLENGLYQYRGGGYDGCYWEWNYAVIIEGEFHNIFSSGSAGCPTKEDLAEALAGDVTVYVYPLTVDGITEYVNASEPSTALAVIEALENLGQVFDIKLVCADCQCTVALDEMQATGLASAGGSVVQYTRLVCLECKAAIEGGYL